MRSISTVIRRPLPVPFVQVDKYPSNMILKNRKFTIAKWYIMNRFQAMAMIMAILKEDGGLKPGTLEYKIARRLITRKIDQIGPKATFEHVKRWKNELLNQIDTVATLEELEEKFPFLKF